MQVEECFDIENINVYDVDGHSRNNFEVLVKHSFSTRQKIQITGGHNLFRALSRPWSPSTHCAGLTPTEVPFIHKVRVRSP